MNKRLNKRSKGKLPEIVNSALLPGMGEDTSSIFNPQIKGDIVTIPLRETKKHTAISIHTVNQFYENSVQGELFSDETLDRIIETTGITLINRPEGYGVVLNQGQKRVFEGILKAFSDTNYLGDEQVDKRQSLKEVYPKATGNRAKDVIDEPYKNVDKIPVIKLTQAELIKLSGYDLKRQRQGDKDDVVQSIAYLATKQFCFYWTRLAKDEQGRPKRDKAGDWLKEEVTEVGSLLRVKTVRAEGTGEFKYYEIQPSLVILDQVNKHYGGPYFLLVPTDWRDEVKKLTGKRASSYTYEFLFWLRLRYESIRKHNSNHSQKQPYTIIKSWEQIAVILKMPESVYKRQRPRANKIIQEAYATAIKLNYLLKVEDNGAINILYLNEDYYPKPGELV